MNVFWRRQSRFTLAFCGALVGSIVFCSELPAATVFLSDMLAVDDELGTPSETRNTVPETYTTYHGRTVDSVTNVDTKDATFRLLVDFDPLATGSDNEVLWETGGGTVGMSLAYVADTNTLTLRQVSNSGNTILQVDRVLTLTELQAGDLDLVWTIDIDGDGSGVPVISLWVEGDLAGDGTNASSQQDWSGTNGAGLGQPNSGVAAGGGNSNLPDTVAFAAGTINDTEGLQFWADTYATVVPEPSAFAIGLLGLAGLCFLATRGRLLG